MIVAIAGIVLSLPWLLLSVAAIDSHCREQSFLRDSKILSIAELGAAWFLGLMFVCGGLSKLMPFPGVMGPVWLEDVLHPYGLGLYARFIAWSEALIGLCLLSKYTRVVGAIMMVPLLLNILMVTVSMNWRGTPWVIMVFLFANVFLLSYHYPRWRPTIDGSRWIKFKSPAQTRVTRLATATSLLAIITAPISHLLHPLVSAAVVALAIFVLLCFELLTRFQYGYPVTTTSTADAPVAK